MREKKKTYGVLVGMIERKRPLGRPRFRWECNIKMDLKQIEWRGMNWIHLVPDRCQ
jgi:hypothetical protein